MLDHTSAIVSNFVQSERFYQPALAKIGYAPLAELPTAASGDTESLD